MRNLYLTADAIGAETGGGSVTANEAEALKSLGPCTVLGRGDLEPIREEPWGWDDSAQQQLGLRRVGEASEAFHLAHIYSGTFGDTVRRLKERGTKVSYTIAAHDRRISREEHLALGMPFPYPHLTDEVQWQRYIEGYRLADAIVCPSNYARNVVRDYGPEFRDKRIEVIPHGCTLPKRTTEPPQRFVVGYLGAVGPDKGLIYLLRTWKQLNYQDAVLVIGGRDSNSPGVQALADREGGGGIALLGWQDDVSDFYDRISLYVQPSATEGFGIEVLEACAHRRQVICSTNAGAEYLLPVDNVVEARDVAALAERIDRFRKAGKDRDAASLDELRSIAKANTWDRVRSRYVDLWRSM